MLFPLVLLVVLAVAQSALSAHASAAVQAAAEHGVEVSAAFGAQPADGELAVGRFLASTAMLHPSSVVVESVGAGLLRLTVTAQYSSFLGSREVVAAATAPIERVPR